jgi:hypothetical protein
LLPPPSPKLPLIKLLLSPKLLLPPPPPPKLLLQKKVIFIFIFNITSLNNIIII